MTIKTRIAALTRPLVQVVMALGLIGCLSGCDQPLLRNDLEVLQARGRLIMVTRSHAASYYQGPSGPTGFEYDLAKAFADHLGVALHPLVLEEEAEMVAALRHGEADIVAAGIPFGQQAMRLMAMGPGYLEVRELVIGHRNGPSINTYADLSQATVWLTASSAQIELLKQLDSPDSSLSWQIFNEFNSEAMLEMVWKRMAPLTIIESNIFKMNHRFFPELVVHLDLGPTRQLAWAMNPNARYLQQAAIQWFAQPATKELIDGLVEHYFSHLDDFDYVDLARYRRRISSRLPKYRLFFETAAEKHQFDWQLIAAQAYQESHWNPSAESFTGVRGIMMVTQDTAKGLGLPDRLAPEEGIIAGTRYLARLYRLLDDDIVEPDRTFMALAAYNLGLGHLQDARRLARKMGKSDRTWRSIRSVLPLLQQKKYYQDLDYGYARGSEAVQYVDHIRTYHKVLGMTLAKQASGQVQAAEKQQAAAEP